MPNTIDSLMIEIDSNSANANRALDKLADRLLKIDQRIRGINVGSFSKDMKQLSDAANSFTGVENFNKTITSLRKLSGIKADNFTSVANGVSAISRAFSGMSAIPNFSGLESFINSLRKMVGVSIERAVQNLPQLSSSLSQFINSMNGIGTLNFDVTGLSGLISSISKLGGAKSTQAVSNLPTISAQLQNFVRQMNGIGSLKFNMDGLISLVSSISKLGGKSATQAIPNISALTAALKKMMQTLSTAPQVSENIIRMTNALANLASQGSRTGTATNSIIRGLNRFSLSAISARKHAFNLAAAFGKLYANFWFLRRGFSLIKKSIDISSDLTEVQNVVDVTFGNMKSKVEEMSKTSIQDFGMSELTVKQISSRFQAMGVAMGYSQRKMSDMSVSLTQLAADMASFYNVEQADVAQDLESIFTGQTRPLRTYGLDLTQATLQEWAMKQGIDADIKAMSQAEKTMLRYQYVMANTTAAQGDFARTANTWANQTRILKQSFEQLGGIIGGVAINAFKPFVSALNVVLQKVISFAKTVADALGAIFGWTLEIDTGGLTNDLDDIGTGADDAASGLDGAASSAKDLKDALTELPIDQLHKLSSATTLSSGSGSGSGASGAADGSGAEAKLVRTESILEKYKSSIDSLYELGDYIGTTLTKAMENIDWESIYQGAKNFGSGLASFLNGLISPELFGAVGKTIAGALNTAIYAALSFGETFDWSDFGKSIAAGINKFFETYDFESLAKTLNTWVDGVIELIASILKNIKWKDVAEKLGSFVLNLEPDTALILGFSVFWKLAGGKVVKATASTLGTAILSALGYESWSALGASLGTITLPLTVGIVLSAVSWSFGEHGFKNLKDSIQNLKDKIAQKKQSGDDTSEDESYLKAMETAYNNMGGDLGYSGMGLKQGATISDFQEAIKTMKKEMEDLWDTSAFGKNLETAWSNFKEYAKQRKLQMSASIESFKDNIKNKWIKFKANVEGFKDNIKSKWIKFKANFTEWKDSLKSKSIGFKAKISSFINSIKESDRWLSFKAKLKSFINSIQENKRFLEFKAKITSFIDNIKEKVIGGFSARKNAGGGIYKGGQWHPIQGYASGGTPQSARLFYANENGIPELIGRIGSNTAVMNNGQIVASVAAGVYRAVVAAFSQLRQYFASMSSTLSLIPGEMSALAASIKPGDLFTGQGLSSPSVPKMVNEIGALSQNSGSSFIADATEQAVYNAMVTANASRGGSGGGKIEMPIYLDGKEIYRAVLDYDKLRSKRYNLEPRFV